MAHGPLNFESSTLSGQSFPHFWFPFILRKFGIKGIPSDSNRFDKKKKTMPYVFDSREPPYTDDITSRHLKYQSISGKDQNAQKTNKFPNNMQNANNPYLIIYIKIKPKSLFCISVSLLRHTIKQICVYFLKYTWFLQLTFDPDVKK